jgi:hypothetical protein
MVSTALSIFSQKLPRVVPETLCLAAFQRLLRVFRKSPASATNGRLECGRLLPSEVLTCALVRHLRYPFLPLTRASWRRSSVIMAKLTCLHTSDYAMAFNRGTGGRLKRPLSTPPGFPDSASSACFQKAPYSTHDRTNHRTAQVPMKAQNAPWNQLTCPSLASCLVALANFQNTQPHHPRTIRMHGMPMSNSKISTVACLDYER